LEQNYDFGIRVDMGNEIGSGHFFRCSSLAKELRNRGKTIIFLVSDENKFFKHTKDNFPFLILNGINEKEKISQCKELMKNIKVIIIDLSHYNSIYSKELGCKNNVVLIDDLGNIDVFSKFLINGSIVKKFQNYSIKNKSTKTFFGPDFMIVQLEFFKERSSVKISEKEIKKILLIFGGSDDENLTSKILPILQTKNYEINVILGPTNTKKDEVNKIIKDYPNVKVECSVEKISELFSKQDLVISSAGITVYELATLGIPTIMIPTTAAQIETAIEIEKRGFGINYGIWDNNSKRLESVLSKMNNYDLRYQMYESGRKIIDGLAVKKISDFLQTLV